MVTCIDVGNSTTKIARVTDDAVDMVARMATTIQPDTTAFRDALDGAALDGAMGPIVLVSVVPAWTAAIRELTSSLGLDLLEADAASIPLPVHVAHPPLVGADRLLGAWTARELFGAPVVVVDIGTATTLDVVDGTGAFVGGAIMPGPELAIRSLATDTALLPRTLPRLPERAIGRDTVEAIQSGVVLGHLVAIRGLLALMTDELGGPDRPTVVLTGGGSTALGAIEGVDHIEPVLLLRGLGMLAELPVVRR
jgi:type III pantothenate kinase